MLNRLSVPHIAWPVVDQGVASLGNFLLTVTLARMLPPEDYGIFALLFGILMILYTVMSSLLFYPLSVIMGASRESRADDIMQASFVLMMALCGPASLVLCIVSVLADRFELIIPLILYFLVWQVQEAFRRYLFIELRFKAAVPGEIISYLGQSMVVIWLARHDGLTLESALYAMALTSALAAVLQAVQVRLPFRIRKGLNLRKVAQDFWSLGGWALAYNILTVLRVQVLFWFLAALSGAAFPALLQAAMNVVNLLNPLMIGLGNVILQVAARAHIQGKAEAWRASYPFIFAGLPIIFLSLAIVVSVPNYVLSLIYGPTSPYISLTGPLRLLAIAAFASYLTDLVCGYFYGVSAAKEGLIVNAVGAIVAILTAVPLIIAFELNGACLSLCLANGARLIALQLLFSRLIASDQGGSPPPTGEAVSSRI